MNILFLTRRFYPHIGGVEKHVEKISLELIKQGHQVTVLTQKHQSQLSDKQKYKKITIVRIPDFTSKWQVWKTLWSQRKLFQQADLIHCHDIFFWYLPFRFLYPAKPVFTTFHGWEGKFPVPKKNIILRKIWEKLSWGTICVGDYLKIWYHHRPDLVTYGAVDTIDEPKLKTVPKDYVFIGRLSQDTGLNEYLKAFKALKQKNNVRFVFIGDGPYKKQCQELGRVAGMVKNPLPYLIKAKYIFSSSYLATLEALILKRPLFAFCHNQLKLDCFQLHPAAKFINISSSWQELIKQLVNVTDKSKAGFSWAKTQTWRKLTQDYLSLWQSKTNLSV